MSEKGIFPSRFLFYIITISMFLLLLSSVFLLQFGKTSLIPRSVLKLILLNGTSVYLKPNVKNEKIKLPFLSSESSQVDAQLPMKNGESSCQKSSYGKKMYNSWQQKFKSCNTNQDLLRVYMYDLPFEFHFGLLGWKGKSNQMWPDVNDPSRIPSYPGGLNLQHSMEYWLTLDLLSSNTPNVVRPCAAIRVKNSSQADVIFVPFFSSLSYNRHSKLQGKEKVSVNEMLQNKLVQFLNMQDEWKRFGGKDHLIVAHHPNSMLDARGKLGSAMFVLSDFGRYPTEIANLEKDIIAPYRHVVRTIPGADSAPFDKRPILVFFQGAIYRKDVSFLPFYELNYLNVCLYLFCLLEIETAITYMDV
ncbi:hypothetical protein CRYUN_Cryun13aG0035800 [Craigia yunnanensis]